MPSTLHDVYDRLFTTYGPQNWWPAKSPFEVLIGAVLVQNTAWTNVVKAIDRLEEADLLEPRALWNVAPDELEELIRPAGYYRVKARRLRSVLEFLLDRFDGSLDAMFAGDLSELRAALLAVNGVGPETADSILLYAGGLPTFVVDAYTRRVLARHGWIDFDADYDTIQDHFQSTLEPDASLYNEFHALFVQVGKLHCRKRSRCDGCPLFDLLPEGGPMEPEF